MFLKFAKTVTECAEGEFMCDISRCLPPEKVCDRNRDCRDGTDESDCPSKLFFNSFYYCFTF